MRQAVDLTKNRTKDLIIFKVIDFWHGRPLTRPRMSLEKSLTQAAFVLLSDPHKGHARIIVENNASRPDHEAHESVQLHVGCARSRDVR